jgi:hypothetical protein
MLSKYISLPIFLVSFAIGLFCIYVLGPEQKKIYVYPSPNNYSKMQFKDITKQCFEIKPVEKECPINPLAIKSIPIQT